MRHGPAHHRHRSGGLFWVNITAPEEAEYSFTKCGQLHVAPFALEHLSSSHLSPNTFAYDLLCREGATTESHTTNGCHRERLKPLDSRVEDPEKSEGVLALDDSHILFSSAGGLDPLRLGFTIGDADAREVGPSGIEAHERGGALLVADAAPALPKELLASNSSARLTELPPLSLRRLHHGHKARLSICPKHCCNKASTNQSCRPCETRKRVVETRATCKPDWLAGEAPRSCPRCRKRDSMKSNALPQGDPERGRIQGRTR